MEWPEDLAGALPAPRRDEPPDLRRRIVAEVRDHLDTAFQRELLRTPDASQARRNVLAQFGDPLRLARKLYFDAMWEKIMMQRGMLVALVAMVLVSLGSMGLTWFMVAQASQVNQAILEQSRALNESILARLESLGEKPAEAGGKSAEWVPLKFRVTWDKPDGPPAAGVRIAIQGNAYGQGSTGSELERTTGPDGIADFGLVKPGQYLVNAATPSGETIADMTSFAMGFLQMSGQLITLLPGQTQPQELVCPSLPPETEISLAVDWPEKLQGQPLWLVCEFAQQPRELAGRNWARDESQPQLAVVDSAGRLMTPDIRGFGPRRVSSTSFLPQTESLYAEEESRSYVKESKSFVDVPGIYRFRSREHGWGADGPAYVWLPKSDAVSQLTWPAGTYRLSHLVVARDVESADPSLTDDLFHPEFLGAIEFAESPEARDRLIYPDERSAETSRRKRREVKAELPPFAALPGQHNEWRLPIPPRLVDMLTEPKAPQTAPETVHPALGAASRPTGRAGRTPDWPDDDGPIPTTVLPDDPDNLPPVAPRRRLRVSTEDDGPLPFDDHNEP